MTSFLRIANARVLAFAVLVNVPLAPWSAAQTETTPALTFSQLTSQSVDVSWLAAEGEIYQLESSSSLSAWTNTGPVIIGGGNVVTVTHYTTGNSRTFVRFKQLAAGTIVAIFHPPTGTLTIAGREANNTINVSRNAAGVIFVNAGAVPIFGGVPTVANTNLIKIFGGAGNDGLTLDETAGALPRSRIEGGIGDDTLTGGSNADELNGGAGVDTLRGAAGADTLRGGDDNDQVFGDGDADRIIWNPGDDTDLNEGGDNTDTVEVNGGGGAEQFTATANGTRVRFDRLNPAPFSLDIGTSENLVLNANGGDDSFSATGPLSTLIQITVDGGAGLDTLLGSNGADVLLGGDNDDFIDGQQGNDTVFMGAGNDTFQWDPGDGSDIIEGQADSDTLLFNGSGGAEIFAVFANGPRAVFTRNLGNIVMDLDDVENLDLNALGAADTLTVNDMTGTDLTSVDVDLASTIGGGAGDGQPDIVVVNGSSADDIATATLSGDQLLITGMAASVRVAHFETAFDSVRINGLGGDDIIDASAVAAGGPPLAIDGGPGNDILLGAVGSDSLLGGDNDDVLLGNGGVDVLDGGTGDNILLQDGSNVTSGIVSIFGDGQDNGITISRDVAGNLLSNGVAIPGATVANTELIRVFGQGGNDTMTFNEAGGALPAAMLFGGPGTNIVSGGAGGDLIFGGINADTLLGRGGFDFLFGGAGADTLTGGDADDQVFSGADADRMIWNPGDDTDLNEGGPGTDIVEVNGGGAAEQFTATANGTRVRFDRVNPAPFALDIGTSENLVLNANGGDDSFSATGPLASLIQITVDGGAGLDTLLGSNGADVLLGGDNDDFIDGQQGNDTVFMGAGNDTFQWDPGDGSDTIEGQADNDTLLFNGSGGAEIFAVFANGQRAVFTRNLGNIVMDLDDVENLDLNALGAADVLTVNDMTGTDLTSVDVDLASTIGGGAGDGQPDIVVVNGSSADDIATATLSGDQLLITGMAASVRVAHFETAFDSVRINGLGGDDIIDASAVAAGGPPLAIDGGPGNDILLGAVGSDTLTGGDNDDVLLGNGGVDVLDGGTGDNILLQDGSNVTSGIVSIFGDGQDNTITISRDAGGNLLSNGVAIPGATVANTELIRVFGQGGNDTMTFNEAGGALPAGMLFGGSGDNTLTGGAGGDLLFGGSNIDTVLGRGGFDFLFGGAGADTLTGGDADDQVFSGADADRMIWNPGDDTDLNEGGPGTDIVEVNGGGAAEQFTATANGTRVRFDRVNPAPFALDIGTSENLVLNANGGDDSFSATGALASLIQITVDGGAGLDTLLGSNGADVLLGGDNDDFIDGQQGNDTVFMGAGNDTFQWDPGDGSDTIEGQADNDTLLFNGSGGAEIFAVFANGQRAVFTRNLGNIVMDLDDVENLDLNALGAADTLTVNDMTGTDLTSVDIDLASTIGGGAGDGQPDAIVVNGTASADAISLTASAGVVSVSGLPALVRISHPEVANDALTVNGLGGADTFNTDPGATALIGVTTNQ